MIAIRDRRVPSFIVTSRESCLNVSFDASKLIMVSSLNDRKFLIRSSCTIKQ